MPSCDFGQCRLDFRPPRGYLESPPTMATNSERCTRLLENRDPSRIPVIHRGGAHWTGWSISRWAARVGCGCSMASSTQCTIRCSLRRHGESVPRVTARLAIRRLVCAETLLEEDLERERIRRGLPACGIEVFQAHTGPRGGVTGRARLILAVLQSGSVLLGRDLHDSGGLFVNESPTRRPR